MKTGINNSITDVKGVLVGHATLVDGDIQTGVTAILPKPTRWFEEKLKAACHVINGFGKSIGLVQLNELYTIETPILLTNTLSAPHVADGLIKFMLTHNQEIGGTIGTVNPIVCECNDSYLNNIRRQVITEYEVLDALNNATDDFQRGAVGAGRGMSCYQLKGGIGTSSRLIEIDNQDYTIGGLVLANMGKLPDLVYQGQALGKRIQEEMALEDEKEQGSIIVIIATDVPLATHQLKRVAKRATAGIARTGSYIGHGSGDISIVFTTDSPVPLNCDLAIRNEQVLHDTYMDLVFKATVEVVESSIVDALLSADEVTGFQGHNRKALKHFIK